MKIKSILQKIYFLSALVLMIGASSSAFAGQKAGDFTIYAGWGYVDPGASADVFNLPKTPLGPVEIPILAYKNSNASFLGLALGYMFTNNWGMTFDFGTPPSTTGTADLKVAGHATGNKDIASLKFVSPRLMVRYTFGSPTDSWRFNVGVGLAYTKFSNVEVMPDASQLADTASVDSKISPVVSAGLAYSINDHWSINGTMFYNQINTNLHTNKATLGEGEANVKLNPLVLAVTVGYSF